MRNIILISLDTLRAASMSCYGHSNLTTPHLDALAEKSTLFESCISPHIPTHPAHTTMFTGKDVLTHQIITQGGSLDLATNVKTVAELLSEAGYFTVAADNLGRWFQRGFSAAHYRGYQWENRYRCARKAEAVNQTAMQLLDVAQTQEKPWFAFLHYWDPHTPYLPPLPFERMFYSGDECAPSNRSMDAVYACEPFTDYFLQWMCTPDPAEPDNLAKKRLWTDRRYVNAQYDASIAYMDACLAQLFRYLQDAGVLAETLLVITADHGEELDEHELWYDHHGLYQTNCHVPLIVHCPALMTGGQRLDGLVSLKDIAPTLLDYAGQSELAQRGKDGRREFASSDGGWQARWHSGCDLPHRMRLDEEARVANQAVETDSRNRGHPGCLQYAGDRALRFKRMTRTKSTISRRKRMMWWRGCVAIWMRFCNAASRKPASPIRRRRRTSPCGASATKRRRCRCH